MGLYKECAVTINKMLLEHKFSYGWLTEVKKISHEKTAKVVQLPIIFHGFPGELQGWLEPVLI